jgi:[acyl-carrier-protein] S-malonyltransferase
MHKKLAFLFPGQGSQAVGMGRELADRFPAAAQTFAEADEALGLPLSKLIFEGPEEELRLTENTQPAILAVSVAALRVLAAHGVEPALAAGHSLGEWSAHVAAGTLGFADAVRAVKARGKAMQLAVPAGQGAMAAVLALDAALVAEACREAEAETGLTVAAANLNSPSQTVISGAAAAVERASALCKAKGARRAVPLPVSAPFHCALMKPAQERLRTDLEATEFRDLNRPLVNNWQAREVRTGAEAREGLYQQVPNPVRWVDSIRYLEKQGVAQAVEVGAGGVLTGLLRGIAPSIAGLKFGEPADVEKLPGR